MTRHLVIPDLQVRPGLPSLEWVSWISEYACDARPDVIVNLGDTYDFPSLSAYDGRGSKAMENLRLWDDIEAGDEAFRLLDDPISRKRSWSPRKIFLHGNHENRLSRAIDANPQQLEGVVSLDDLDTRGWEVYPYLLPVTVDGISFAHFWYRPMSGRPYSGSPDLRLRHLGFTAVQGHEQGLQWATRYTGGRNQNFLVAGSCYPFHCQAEYRGPQAGLTDPQRPGHWNGVVVLNEVDGEGGFDICTVSLDYLARKYAGMRLADWVAKVSR